jgi:hypothetical protein
MIQETLKRAFKEINGILTTKMATSYGIHDLTLKKSRRAKNIQKH